MDRRIAPSVRIEEAIETACRRVEEWYRSLPVFEPRAIAGGGAVVLVLSGTQDIKDVRIQKDAVDPEDVESLQDLVRAAFADALGKSRDLAAQRLGSVTGGLRIPGM